jgi:hypothetical protein
MSEAKNLLTLHLQKNLVQAFHFMLNKIVVINVLLVKQ